MLKERGEKQNTAVNCERTFACVCVCVCTHVSVRILVYVCVCVYGNNVGEI